MTRSTLLVCLLLAALPATAQIYQWRDAEGKLNYSDRPPPGVDARVMKGTRSSTTTQPPSTPAPESGATPAAAEPSTSGSAADAPPPEDSSDIVASDEPATDDSTAAEVTDGGEAGADVTTSEADGSAADEAATPATSAATPAASPAAVPEAREKTAAEKELEFRQRRAAIAEARAKAEAEAKQKEERDRVCTDMRSNLAALESGQRVSRFNASGERVFIDDATRAAEIQRYRNELRSKCAP